MRATSIAALVVSLPFALSAQDGNTQIKNEIERLERSIKTKPIVSSDMPKANSVVEDALKVASASLRAGRVYVALERLGQAHDFLGGARTVVEKGKIAEGGLSAFETEWAKANLALSALEREARSRNWTKSPAALRALSEVAQGRSLPLLEGARGFALATGPRDGLFYMGQAQGEAEFAKFCAGLMLTRKGPALPRRSMLPELLALQEKVNAAFQPPRSIEQHPRFISLNAAIKTGRELDAQTSYSGSLYQYLDAVRHYGMLDEPTLDAGRQEKLKKSLSDARTKIEASAQDDSIALLFLERADSQIASHPDGTAPTADEWRSAQVIAGSVLPAYYATLNAPAALPQSPGKTVDITLVRWPYT